ncbi:phage integrase N-terminal SAM-like domain-containing protein, partial [Segetibacter koreensis]|uniref:phage integrase N-terminal SAM-like domain-containing protein n=1 Tax=Segetibacter koreensis TaxID=398037 RepID=UPI003CCC037B
MEKTDQYLSLGHYSIHTVRNYLSELRYLLVYYAEVSPSDFTEDMLMEYLLYLAKTLGC